MDELRTRLEKFVTGVLRQYDYARIKDSNARRPHRWLIGASYFYALNGSVRISVTPNGEPEFYGIPVYIDKEVPWRLDMEWRPSGDLVLAAAQRIWQDVNNGTRVVKAPFGNERWTVRALPENHWFDWDKGSDIPVKVDVIELSFLPRKVLVLPDAICMADYNEQYNILVVWEIGE